jgi:hypothetical protein
MRPVAFGEALAAGTRLTLFSGDKPDRFFTVIKFWMDETSGVALALETGVPSYQIEDEEGRTHLLIHLGIKEEDEDRWCLWRLDHAGFDSRSIFEAALVWLAGSFSICPALHVCSRINFGWVRQLREGDTCPRYHRQDQ